MKEAIKILEVTTAALLAVFLSALGVLLARLTRKKNYDISRSFKYFVWLAIFRLGMIALFSFFMIKIGGNIFLFLLTFATVFSLLLFPEVILIMRTLER